MLTAAEENMVEDVVFENDFQRPDVPDSYYGTCQINDQTHFPKGAEELMKLICRHLEFRCL